MESSDLELKAPAESPLETAEEFPARSQMTFGWDDSVRWTPIGFGADAEPTVFDWFGRGGADLLVTSVTGERGLVTRVYHPLPPTDDQPLIFDRGVAIPELDGLRFPCPFPNDGPSRFDLIALGMSGLVFLANSGEPDYPRFASRKDIGIPADLGIGPGRVSQMVAVDWDGDGLTDLLIGYDDLEDYWPEKDLVPRSQQIGFNQKAGHPGYDRAGHWRGKPPVGRVVWFRNTGRPGEPRFAPVAEVGDDDVRVRLGPRPTPLLVAWAGRGGWEFLLSDAKGELLLHRNFGGQRPPVLMEPRPLRLEGRALILPEDRTVLVAGDVDGDRREELIFGRSDGRVFAIHAGTGRDEVRAPTPLLHEGRDLWLGGHAVLTVGDLDADGDLDLIVGDASGRIYLLEDRGTGSNHRYAAPVELEAGGVPFRLDPGADGVLLGPAEPRLGFACPALVDWSENGRLDLLLGGAGGDVIYLRNNGGKTDPRFDFPRPIRCEGGPLFTPPRVRPAAADWFESGRSDLLSLDLQGFLCVYPRVEGTDVGAPVHLVDRLGRLIRLDGGFGLAGRCTLWAGPWTRSGRVDLLVGLPRDARSVVPAITGERIGDLSEISTVLLLEHVGRNVMIPRQVRHADGRPLIVGHGSCSPCGIKSADGEELDLLIGSDDGQLEYFRRDALRW